MALIENYVASNEDMQALCRCAKIALENFRMAGFSRYEVSSDISDSIISLSVSEVGIAKDAHRDIRENDDPSYSEIFRMLKEFHGRVNANGNDLKHIDYCVNITDHGKHITIGLVYLKMYEPTVV